MDLEVLEEKLGIKFKDRSLLQCALTTREYSLTQPEPYPPHNERLEFLGDAVLGCLVAEYVFLKDNYSEGVMTCLKDGMINRKYLSLVATNLDLLPHILLPPFPISAHKTVVTLADCLEAVIGAIYLDQGGEACREFMTRHLFSDLPPASMDAKFIMPPKVRLNNEVQAALGISPIFETFMYGSGRDFGFVVVVQAGEIELGRGHGPSIKKAEGWAITDALRNKLYQKTPNLQ